MEHVSPDISGVTYPPPAPFRFEDLGDKPEPKEWGKAYPNLGAAVEKYRKLAKARELTPDETRAHGAAVGVAIRALQRRELCGDARLEVDLRSTCVTLSGRTQAASDAAYERWLVKLAQIREARAWGYTGGNMETVALIAPAAKKRHWREIRAIGVAAVAAELGLCDTPELRATWQNAA